MKAKRTGKQANVQQVVEGYERTHHLYESAFKCGLCGHNVVEMRYSGRAPRICAACYEKYPTPAAARQSLWRKDHPDEYAARVEQQRQRRAAQRKGSGG